MKTRTIVRIEEDDPKNRKLMISEQLPIGDSVVGMRDGGSGDSIRRVDSQGHSVAVDQTREVISELLEGPTVQNEKGTRATCQILMEKLNALGGDWAQLECPAKGPENGVDGRLYARCNEKRTLDIQVTKADARIWGQLARNKSGVKRNRAIEDVCTSLREAIEKKKSRSDSTMILALEAVHCPVPPSVADHFVKNYQLEAERAGFKEVWLVGSLASLTYKLA